MTLLLSAGTQEGCCPGGDESEVGMENVGSSAGMIRRRLLLLSGVVTVVGGSVGGNVVAASRSFVVDVAVRW